MAITSTSGDSYFWSETAKHKQQHRMKTTIEQHDKNASNLNPGLSENDSSIQ